MRLIDADELFDRLLEMWGDYVDTEIASMFMQVVNDAPTIAPPPNEPLTLEQPREMDGEPVCITPVDGGSYAWMLVDTKYELCREAHGGLAVFENLGKTWLAYRHRPEGAKDA